MGQNPLNKAETILLEKYKLLVTQIIHWDTHYWNKSKFFLAIETAFLSGAIAALSPVVKDEIFTALTAKLLLGGGLVFNIMVCYIWARTSRRNLQYRELKIVEFLKIEKKIPVLQLLSKSHVKSILPDKDRSTCWENTLPYLFMAAWIFTSFWGVFGDCWR